MRFLLASVALLFAGCWGTVEPPVVITTTDPCVLGCQNLAKPEISCEIAWDPNKCTTACDTAIQKNEVQWALGYIGPFCWAKATDKKSAQACPGIGIASCP